MVNAKRWLAGRAAARDAGYPMHYSGLLTGEQWVAVKVRVTNRLGFPASGLSPRGRGNPPLALGYRGQRGSIPAWAGEPTKHYRIIRLHRVYPRVGGGTA